MARDRRYCSLLGGSIAVEATLSSFWADRGLSDDAKALLPNFDFFGSEGGSSRPPIPPATGSLAARVLVSI